MELFKANAQWSTRPEDERFASVQALYDATKAYADIAKVKDVQTADLRVEAVDGDVQLVGTRGIPARLTHWAFGQLCSKVGAPSSYLRGLPATLASQNLNHELKAKVEDAADAVSRLLFHTNGSLLLRAITSEKYERIWNYEIADRLLGLEYLGWGPSRPTFNIIEGKDWPDLYASDHDLFAFLRNQNLTIEEKGRGALYRGIIVENSEVGASSLRISKFIFREQCGNHIIWGAQDLSELAIRHVGTARDKFGLWSTVVKKYAEESVSEEEAKIEYARGKFIAASKEEVLDAVFGKKQVGLSKTTLEAGYDAVVEAEDGDPRTVWGLVQGITRHSQTVPFADQRTQIDKAAGRILEVNF